MTAVWKRQRYYIKYLWEARAIFCGELRYHLDKCLVASRRSKCAVEDGKSFSKSARFVALSNKLALGVEIACNKRQFCVYEPILVIDCPFAGNERHKTCVSLACIGCF